MNYKVGDSVIARIPLIACPKAIRQHFVKGHHVEEFIGIIREIEDNWMRLEIDDPNATHFVVAVPGTCIVRGYKHEES